MAAVELGADLHVELAPSHRLIGELGIRRRLPGCPKADEHLALAAMKAFEGLVLCPGVAPNPTGQRSRRSRKAALGFSLIPMVGCPARCCDRARTESGPGLLNLAAHQVQVDDFANGVDRMLCWVIPMAQQLITLSLRERSAPPG